MGTITECGYGEWRGWFMYGTYYILYLKDVFSRLVERISFGTFNFRLNKINHRLHVCHCILTEVHSYVHKPLVSPR